MRIQNNTCSQCGETQYTEYCEFCEPNMVWEYEQDAMEDAPPTPEPSDVELEEMAAYYASLSPHFASAGCDELVRPTEAEIDYYDSFDHDHQE